MTHTGKSLRNRGVFLFSPHIHSPSSLPAWTLCHQCWGPDKCVPGKGKHKRRVQDVTKALLNLVRGEDLCVLTEDSSHMPSCPP